MARRDKLGELVFNTAKFSQAVNKYLRRNAKGNREQAGRALFFRLLEKVILKTPLDTGRARGGWGAGADQLGIPLPPGPGVDEGKALSKYEEKKIGIDRLRLSVTNSVAYIEFLEKGTSTQAPFGMVAISERELEAELGGRKIPRGIFAIYEETWAALGPGFEGTELRAGLIRDALGLGAGANVGAL